MKRSRLIASSHSLPKRIRDRTYTPLIQDDVYSTFPDTGTLTISDLTHLDVVEHVSSLILQEIWAMP